MKKFLIGLSFIVCLLSAGILFSSCADSRPHYVIGVSQCSDDIWREKQNAELRMGTYFHDGVKLCFASAYDSDSRQIEQIDSLVASGIDLLIVAPNQVQTISPAIDRAFDQGIPVIVFERKTSSKKYTAFMGADNHEMGRLMGEYIASRLNGRGKVMEIMGLKGSSPAIERDKGFKEAIANYPQIEIVATLQGDWTEQSAFDAVKAYQGDLSGIDFVFGQNDRMAIGARKALSSLHTPHSSLHTPHSTLLTPRNSAASTACRVKAAVSPVFATPSSTHPTSTRPTATSCCNWQWTSSTGNRTRRKSS